MAIDMTLAENPNERLALRMLKAMEDGDMADTMAEICTEDFVWANSGLPTLNGQSEIRAMMARGGFKEHIPILATMSGFSVDLGRLASRSDAVFTERIDHHWDAEGRDLMSPRIAGVIEIRNGKISAMRDYYDVACYQQKPSAPGAGPARQSSGP